MDVFKEFATDEARELEGVWQPISGNTKLLVARAGNKKYARHLAREVEKNQRTLDLKNDEADATSDRIMIDVMADTVLLDWEGVQFKQVSLPYSKENAKKLLGVKDFRMLVVRLSNDFDAYRLAQEEAAVKS